METPKYLLVLAAYKWLLAFGLLVAIAVGLVAGFTIRDGEIVSKVQRTYPASTTLMLSSPSTPLFQTQIPGAQVPLDPSTMFEPPATLNLTEAALAFAYLASGQEVQKRVEDELGPLAAGESITAVSRTTQPDGDENFPGRLSPPALDVVGYATQPQRAELISRTAAREFTEYVIEQQNVRNIEPQLRISLTTLRENPAGEGVGSNPALPIIVAGGGTFAAFLALAFLIDALRSRLARRKARRAQREASIEESPGAVAASSAPEPAPVGRAQPKPAVGTAQAAQSAAVPAQAVPTNDAQAHGVESDDAQRNPADGDRVFAYSRHDGPSSS